MRTHDQALKELRKNIAAAERLLSKTDVHHDKVRWRYAHLQAMCEIERNFVEAEKMEDLGERLEQCGYLAGLWHGLCSLFGVPAYKTAADFIHSPPLPKKEEKDRSPTVKRPKKRGKAR